MLETDIIMEVLLIDKEVLDLDPLREVTRKTCFVHGGNYVSKEFWMGVYPQDD